MVHSKGPSFDFLLLNKKPSHVELQKCLFALTSVRGIPKARHQLYHATQSYKKAKRQGRKGERRSRHLRQPKIVGWIPTMKRSGENGGGGGLKENDEGTSKRLKSAQCDDDDDKPEGCSEVLHLNVGGDLTAVLRRTLTSVEGSMLASRFSGRWDNSLERDRDGNFFIDQVR